MFIFIQVVSAEMETITASDKNIKKDKKLKKKQMTAQNQQNEVSDQLVSETICFDFSCSIKGSLLLLARIKFCT